MSANSEPVPAGAREAEKNIAAQAAAELVEEGMVVGLGTGTTVAYLLLLPAKLNDNGSATLSEHGPA